jgi:hypothetical protein
MLDDFNASQSAEQVCLDGERLLKSGEQEERISKLILRQLTPRLWRCNVKFYLPVMN